MLSINYAKKNGSGYVISFYADTVEDITNFDPTKSFGIYGIPQKGSIITLVSGTDSVNYYLGDSGEIVKIEVGGDEPAGDLTPFTTNMTVKGMVIDPNGKTTDEINAFLNSYSSVDKSLLTTSLEGVGAISLQKDGKGGYLLFGYWALLNDNIKLVCYTIDGAEVSGISFPAGWSYMETDPNDFSGTPTPLTETIRIEGYQSGISEIDQDFDQFNGTVFGAIEDGQLVH